MGKKMKKEPQLVDNVADSSDEEIDEDLAFNSDDERMYGEMFKSKNTKRKRERNNNSDDSDSSDDDDDSVVNDGDDDDGSEASDGIASDDEDGDGDGGQFMLDLLNNLDKKENDTKREKEDMRAAMAHTALISESEYSSTAVKSSSLTLDQLMSGITDTKGFKSVKNVMKDMTSEIYENDASSKLSTTHTPVARVVSERAERKVHYEDQSEEVTNWAKVVKTNREAETLDFRPKDRVRINKAELVQKFEPTTDFEKEIAAALEEAGTTDEKDIMKREEEEMFGNEDEIDDDDDDLGRNKLSAAEYRKRLRQLSKMRALMFYEEQKRYHINKIKSKKYRKIRKKKKLRTQEEEEKEAAENDEELARELDEKAEMDRMKERMSLKHRNTSKWAKRVLRRGGNIDIDTRKALSEQIRKGDELKKKMQGQFGDSDDDETDLVAQARNILVDTEQDEETKKNTGIFKLAFMKKGIEDQRNRAKEEARELLRELEGNESGEESISGSDEEGEKAKIKSKKKNASAKEMKSVLSEGKLVASSLKFGNSASVQVTGDIDISLSKLPTEAVPQCDNTKTLSLETVNKVEEESEIKKSETTASQSKVAVTKVDVDAKESNPWLVRGTDEKESGKSGGSKKRNKKSSPSVSKKGIVNVADAVNIISGEDSTNNLQTISEKKDVDKSKSNAKIASLTQDELVRKAFATPSDKDIEDDFEKEKVRTISIIIISCQENDEKMKYFII
jgi:U3 small nucleolar RNA-associated protein 14